jgi:hypothetical protein
MIIVKHSNKLFLLTLTLTLTKRTSSKIIKMQMFATLDKAKPDTENIRGGGHVYD